MAEQLDRLPVPRSHRPMGFSYGRGRIARRFIHRHRLANDHHYVPLVDAAGTVIALVNPASVSSPAETVTYHPSGTPSASGSANGWPFLYHGMEHESLDPTSSIIQAAARIIARRSRSMSTTGAQGSNGPPGGPGPGGASLPSSAPARPMHPIPEGVFRAPPKGLAPALAQVEASPPSAQNRCSHRTQYQSPSGGVGVRFFELLQDLLGGSPYYPPTTSPTSSGLIAARRQTSAVHSLYWDDSGDRRGNGGSSARFRRRRTVAKSAAAARQLQIAALGEPIALEARNQARVGVLVRNEREGQWTRACTRGVRNRRRVTRGAIFSRNLCGGCSRRTRPTDCDY